MFAAGPRQPYILAAGFILAGLGIGCGETAQAGANLAASAVAGILWTAVSSAAAFLFLTAAMAISVPLILTARQSHSPRTGTRGAASDPA